MAVTALEAVDVVILNHVMRSITDKSSSHLVQSSDPRRLGLPLLGLDGLLTPGAHQGEHPAIMMIKMIIMTQSGIK